MSVYPSEGGPYAQPIAYRQPVQSKTNGMAIASLVLGILWIGGLGSVLAVIFGYLGKNQINASGGTESGRGLAIAGIVLGIVGIVGAIAWLLLIVAVASTSTPTYQ